MCFLEFGKKRAIRTYIRELPRLLARDYGASSSYTSAQINKAVGRYRLNERYIHIAVLLFSSRESFEMRYCKDYDRQDYDLIRVDLANSYFGGNVHFQINDFFAAFDGGQGNPSGLESDASAHSQHTQ